MMRLEKFPFHLVLRLLNFARAVEWQGRSQVALGFEVVSSGGWLAECCMGGVVIKPLWDVCGD